MSTTHTATWLEQTSGSTRHIASFIRKYWDAFRVRRERQKLQAAMSDLSDRELTDIGTTRDEIDYVVWPWFVPGVRAEFTDAQVEGAQDAQLLRIIPGIAMLARPNIRVVLSGNLEWGKNLPVAGNWGAAGGTIVSTTGQAAKFEAQTINATVGVAF